MGKASELTFPVHPHMLGHADGRAAGAAPRYFAGPGLVLLCVPTYIAHRRQAMMLNDPIKENRLRAEECRVVADGINPNSYEHPFAREASQQAKNGLLETAASYDQIADVFQKMQDRRRPE